MTTENPIPLSQIFREETGIKIGRRLVVSSNDFANVDIGAEEDAVVANAIVGFLKTMQSVEEIEAVAFIAVSQSPAPTAISIDVCTSLVGDDEKTANAVGLAGKAKAEFAERTIGILSSGMSFRNTNNVSVDFIEERIREECKEDPNQILLAFCVFER